MKRGSENLCLPDSKRARILPRSSSDPVQHICQSSGLFGCLPLELKYRILTYLPVCDLLSLLQASHAAKFLVYLYIRSGLCSHLRDFYGPHDWAANPQNITPGSLKRASEKYQQIGYLFSYLFCGTLSTNIKLLEDLLTVHTCNEKPVNDSTGKFKCDTTDTFSPIISSLCFSRCSLGGLKCPALFLFGHFLRTFTATWSEADKQVLFHSLVHHCFRENFWHRLTTVVCGAPGSDLNSELTIRLFLRRLFLDPVAGVHVTNRVIRPNFGVRIADSLSQSYTFVTESKHVSEPDNLGNSSCELDSGDSGKNLKPSSNFQNFPCSSCYSVNPVPRSLSSDKLPSSAPLVTRFSETQNTTNAVSFATNSWPVVGPLLRILRSYPMVHQARILFILYGPLHRGQLIWRTLCENTAADSEQLSACFGELGGVLQHMLESGAWSPEDTLAILDEITSTPDDWLAENVACLLYTSGLRIASMVVTKKAVSGNIGDLAVTLTSLCLVRVKIHANLNDLVSLIEDACRASEHANRRQFLDQLARAFQDVIVDLYETDDLEDRIEDFSTILRAQAEFMRALMARVYEE